MNKVLLILIVATHTLVANDSYELKLYERIISSIYPNKVVQIYAQDDLKTILKNSDNFIVKDHCDANIDLLIGENFVKLPFECRSKPIFSTNYRYFKSNHNVFGAFYWRKGRPQIKFKKEILKRYKIILPSSLEKYAK